MTPEGTIDPWAGSVTTDVDAATSWILDQIEPLAAVEVPLSQSRGLVLIVDAIAREASPTFDTSAMDGYAVQIDLGSPAVWQVVGRSRAGQAFAGGVGCGEAIRIMTGAPVPAGANAVVPLELTSENDGVVRSASAVVSGANIRRRGSDHEAGDVVVERGTRLGALHIAVLAAIGHDRPRVVPRARVGVMSTGDEVAARAGSPAGIRDVNRPGLLALVEASGAAPVDLGVADDDPVVLARCLDRAVEDCDAVITTGGVSVGDHDNVKRVLAAAAQSTGGVARWMRVAVRPAKPLAFASLRGVPVFGLPGNPASAFVSFHLFVRPALARLAGDRSVGGHHSFTATASVDFPRRRDGRLHVVPVVAELAAGALSIRPAGQAGAHDLAATAAANAYAYLPDGPTVSGGAVVDCGWIAGAGVDCLAHVLGPAFGRNAGPNLALR